MLGFLFRKSHTTVGTIFVSEDSRSLAPERTLRNGMTSKKITMIRMEEKTLEEKS